MLVLAALSGGFVWPEDNQDGAVKKSKYRRDVFLWKDPGNIAERDLFYGAGGPEGAPKPPFQFVEEDLGGTQPKIEVTDAAGVRWSAKFGEEVHAEVAAGRLFWAFGYLVEETYYVPEGRIEGVGRLKRSRALIAPDGSFEKARFEKRPKHVKREDTWQWNGSPFIGTREFSGLKILVTMSNAWDTKALNNRVLKVTAPGHDVEYWHVISDLGDAFGRMGIVPRKRTTWEIEEFKTQPFIKGVSDRSLMLYYSGHAPIVQVPLEHARWFAGMARNLSERQVRRAFEASGATQDEVTAYSSRVMEKIRDLLAAVGAEAPPEK